MARQHQKVSPSVLEELELRRLLATVTLDTGTTYQTVQGFGVAPIYPTNLVTIPQAGSIMQNAGMTVLRITAGPNEYTYTVGGSMSTPVPISANLDDNVARFNPAVGDEVNLIKWLKTNSLEPDRVKMIGALWSPPHWMKITTGRQISWSNNGVQQTGYDPVLPYGDHGGNTGAGRVNPTMWTDWARFVLSTVKYYQQQAGMPMYAFSFQNEPNVPTSYSSATFDEIANDVNNPSAGFTAGHWNLYGDGVQALATELASHPEITTKFFGPELSQLGGGSSLTSSNPYNLGNYNAVRQNLISRGLLNVLGGWATHEYTNASGGDAALWDAWYNGSQHAANIVSNGTSNNLDWLGPTPGIAGDNKEIWQTETEGEDPTWTKDGAQAFGLKIYNALVFGNVSGYTTWMLTGYSNSDTWGLVNLADINNPTNSFKFDAMKQFSRWIRPGAQRIKATFENGNAEIGGANALDSYNALNVAAFNQASDRRLTMVLDNMQTSSQSTTINVPANMNVSSFQVYVTSGTQKYVQLADLVPSNGQVAITVPASSIVTITGTYGSPLPAPWVSNDYGAPSPAGSASFDSATGTFTITGGGADIWNTSDQFQFDSQSFSGDGSIVALVTSIQNTNAWAKAGVMFRDPSGASGMFADVVVTPSSGVSFQWRNSNGGNCGSSQTTGITAPAWVKLVRIGNSFTAYYSKTTNAPTPSDWIQVGSAQTIAMNPNSQIGLAVTSHNNGTSSTAMFTNVGISSDVTAPTLSNGTFNYKTAQSLSFTFSEDVLASLKAGDFVVTNTTTSTIVPASDFSFGASGGAGVQSIATLTHNVAAGLLPDGHYSVAINNVYDGAGNPMMAMSWPFFVLTGDANHDGFVNANDFTALAQNFNASSASYEKGDFNYDGKVNALDFNVLASRFGATSSAIVSSEPLTATALAAARPVGNLFSADSIGNDALNGLLDTVSSADGGIVAMPERDWL